MTPTTLFLEHFDDLLTTPDAVEQLNAAILQLAIQGKLVPQDPSDEPARELLKRIRESKKDQAELFPVEEDEKPHGLPEGWVWVHIPEVTHNWGQKRPDKAFTYIDVSSIDNQHGAIGNELQIIQPADAPSRARKIVKKGSVIYSTVRPYLLNIAIVDRDIEPEPIVSTAFYVMHPVEGLDCKFLYLYLRSNPFTFFVKSQMTGMAYPAISDSKMSLGIVPSPPLAEQHRIVDRIDQLLAQTHQLADRLDRTQHDLDYLTEAALGQLLNAFTPEEFNARWAFIAEHFDLLFRESEHVAPLRQTILELAVRGKLTRQDPNDEPASELLKRIQAEKVRLASEGKASKNGVKTPVGDDEKPFDVPEGWEWVQLKDLGKTQTGSTPATSNPDFFGNEYLFVKPADISGNSVRYSGDGLSKLGIANGRLIPAESIMMVCIGGSIGKVGYVDKDCSCNQQINAITPASEINGRLLFYFLKAPFFQKEVLNRAPQTTLPILSKGKWEVIPIPLPPLAEQQRIVARVNQLLKLCDTLEAKLQAEQGARETVMQALVAHIQDGAAVQA